MKKNRLEVLIFGIFAVMGIFFMVIAAILAIQFGGKRSPLMMAPLIMGFMGIVFTLVGGLPMLHFKKKSRRRKKLLQSGRTLYAEVEGIDINASYTVNGRHPYVLYCHYRDPYSDITYRFKSDNLWTDPTPYFPAGAEVEVLVMEGDYSTYHVNVEKVLENRVVDYT